MLCEMLTGKMVFRGDALSDTIARILDPEPDWLALAGETPPDVRRVQFRLRDMADARMEIEEALAAPLSGVLDASTAAIAPLSPWWRIVALWICVAGLVTAVAVLALWRGLRLVFNSVRTDSPGTSLFSQVEDGSGPDERLTTTDHVQQPRSFSSDGSLLVFQDLDPDTGYEIP